MATFPAATNYAHDPRPVGVTRFSSGGSGTSLYVTDRSYSGSGSAFLTIPNGGSVTWDAAAAGDGDITAINAPIYSAIHALGASGTGLQARMEIVHTDASIVATAYTPLAYSANTFERTRLGPLSKTAGKTISRILVRVQNPSGSSRTVYVGGLDIRLNSPVDSFIHGDAGVGYAWLGTANNSPSRRDAITIGAVVGSGGSLFPTVRLHVVNRQNQVIREITDHFINGSVSYDLDADNWKGSLQVVLDDPGLIRPFADEYIRVSLHIDYADGTEAEGSLGMFMVDLPQERWLSGSNDQWTYEGKDMLGLLATWMTTLPAEGNSVFSGAEATQWLDAEYRAGSGYTIPAGTTYAAAIKKLLVDHVKLSPSQYALPVTGATTMASAWENNTTILKVLTDVLESAGWKKPWVTPAGIITSARADLRLDQVQPNIVFATGEDSAVRWPFTVDPDGSNIGNRIRVTATKQMTGSHIVGYTDAVLPVAAHDEPNPNFVPKKIKKKWKKKKKEKVAAWNEENSVIHVPDQPGVPSEPIYGPYYYYTPVEHTEVNGDPAHPLSVPRLGRVLDLPDYNLSAAVDIGATVAKAKEILRDASLVPLKVILTTEVMVRGLNEVYDLNLRDSNGEPIQSGQGRYWCRGWNLQLGSPWEMTHSLSRIIEFETGSWN